MANKFKVNQLVLTNNTVTTTGNNLFVNGNQLYPSNNPQNYSTSGDLNNTSGVLALRIQSTGQTLLGLISASSAGVSTLNGQSGTINITGAGDVSVLVNGQNFTVSGATILGTWITLPWNNPIIWNTTVNVVEDRKRIVLTGDSSLVITGLYNGWAGALEIIQSGNSTTGYALALPAGTKVINSGSGILNLTRISGARDIAGFEYNGANLYCAIGNSFN